ncbi:MAG: hypothetical protein M3N57_10845 [Actinomycetota bacterium]|nr:hypothetical protein [Actinomycetota bacterium]
MRPRTRLTAPPRQQPQPVAHGRGDELYGPTFAVPHEPTIRSRWRWPVLIVAVIAIAGLVAFAVVRASSAGRTSDPSLERSDPAASAAPDRF